MLLRVVLGFLLFVIVALAKELWLSLVNV